jgi:hypothetical protein
LLGVEKHPVRLAESTQRLKSNRLSEPQFCGD